MTILTKIKSLGRAVIAAKAAPEVQWVKNTPGSKLGELLTGETLPSPQSRFSEAINKIAQGANNGEALELWDGYGENNTRGPTRTPSEVSTPSPVGNFYITLLKALKPDIMIEFGTAFGASGMYFLAGMEENQKGKLLTFEPNGPWAEIARGNLAQISDRFISTIGTFEAEIDNVLGEDERIDVAFIDGIHTEEFVRPQLELVVARAKSGSVLILDDITFGECMIKYWEEVSRDDRFIASVSLVNRVGLLEMR
jgi:predicted O-methyltransferase YrrM